MLPDSSARSARAIAPSLPILLSLRSSEVSDVLPDLSAASAVAQLAKSSTVWSYVWTRALRVLYEWYERFHTNVHSIII